MTALLNELVRCEDAVSAMPGRIAELRASLTREGERLIDFSFREWPVFRQRFDRHVRQWDCHMRRRVWRAYHTSEVFQAAYDERLEQIHAARLGGESK